MGGLVSGLGLYDSGLGLRMYYLKKSLEKKCRLKKPEERKDVSHNLNSSKGIAYVGGYYGLIKGGTRSVDYSSCGSLSASYMSFEQGVQRLRKQSFLRVNKPGENFLTLKHECAVIFPLDYVLRISLIEPLYNPCTHPRHLDARLDNPQGILRAFGSKL